MEFYHIFYSDQITAEDFCLTLSWVNIGSRNHFVPPNETSFDGLETKDQK